MPVCARLLAVILRRLGAVSGAERAGALDSVLEACGAWGAPRSETYEAGRCSAEKSPNCTAYVSKKRGRGFPKVDDSPTPLPAVISTELRT